MGMLKQPAVGNNSSSSQANPLNSQTLEISEEGKFRKWNDAY